MFPMNSELINAGNCRGWNPEPWGLGGWKEADRAYGAVHQASADKPEGFYPTGAPHAKPYDKKKSKKLPLRRVT